MKRTTIDGRLVVANMKQRRAMALARQALRVFGKEGIALVGALVASLDELERINDGGVENLIAIVHVVREQLPPEKLEELVDLLSGDAADHLLLSILDGVTIGGVVIDRTDENTIDDAYGDEVDAWGPWRVALWLAGEYRLFPSPGGSQSAAGLPVPPEESPDGSTSALDGAPIPQS